MARGRWKMWTSVFVALVLLVGAGVVGSRALRTETKAVQYVALGDSFSSGEGDEAYGWNSSSLKPPNTCHRSTHAYGALLAQSLGAQPFAFIACSGAVTQDFFAPNTNGNLDLANQPEPPQATQVSARTRTITLTLSGNDAGFAQVIDACIYDRLHLYHSPGCATDEDLNSAVDARIAALGGQGSAMTPPAAGGSVRPVHAIRDVLLELHRRAPKATIYLGNYPQLFGDFSASRCKVGSINITTGGTGLGYPVYVSDHDARWMNDVGRRLSDVLQSQVDQAKAAGVPVTFVDVRPQWQGHGFCDTGDPWLLPASGTFNIATRHSAINASSLHPSPEGQAKGYLPAFRAAGAGR